MFTKLPTMKKIEFEETIPVNCLPYKIEPESAIAT